MKKNIIYVLLIILAVNIGVVGSKIPKLAGKKSNISFAEKTAELSSLYSVINIYMSRFFDESKSMIFFKDIGTFAKNHNIKIRTINFSKIDNFDYKIMNFKEIEYDLTAVGSYTDIKNFIFRLDNHKYIGSFSYVKLKDSPDNPKTSGEIVFEAKYNLYIFTGFKKLSGESFSAVNSEELSKDYSKISFDKSDITEKNQSKSIFTLFESNSPESANGVMKKNDTAAESSSVEVTKNKTSTGYEITINKVPEIFDNAVKSDTKEIENSKKNLKGMRYIGYSAGKHNEVKAFIEVNGRVTIVSEGITLTNGYVIKKIDNNFVKIQNFYEPYDIIELGLDNIKK